MKRTAGVWIDHREAVIVFVAAKVETIKVIKSKVERQPGRNAGVHSTSAHEVFLVPADDRRQSSFTSHLNNYYDEVIAALRDTQAILIFGPGEAKGELKRRMEKDKPSESLVAVETMGRMTARQIAAKVRNYFPVESN